MSQPVLNAKNALICRACGTANPASAWEWVLPPVLIVGFWAALRRDAWEPMAMAQHVGLFLLLTILLPIVLVMAVFIAAFVICALNGGPSFHQLESGILATVVVNLLAFLDA